MQSSCLAHKTNCFLTLSLSLSSSLLKVSTNCRAQAARQLWATVNRLDLLTSRAFERERAKARLVSLAANHIK